MPYKQHLIYLELQTYKTVETMEKDSKMTYDSLLCGVCSHDNKIAVTVNEIPVCYDCLRFIENRAKHNGIDKIKQLEIDTSYVALNAT